MTMNTDRRSPARSIVLGLTASAAVVGIGMVGAGAASAAPTTTDPGASAAVAGTYDKKFVSRYYPTPQSAVIGAQINLYLFNSVRLNGNQACSEQPNPVVKPDTPTGWTAIITATCLSDAGTARSTAPVGQ
ncbi:hypothetical protein [Williamsia sp.]|uniref:hypothetical protein n=1 Tax=Williamsia sp. TaxID=1872085 RepID=UPI001A2F9943|nr:hypothetical protein [Williamsia sp.]MBJ7291267.1 hypothetical protein [Williamsia sp.]